jgi:hypothetical protein
MDEGRKRTLGVIAAIFLCRKMAALEGLSTINVEIKRHRLLHSALKR